MKYVDASAVLCILFAESGPTVPLLGGDRIVSSRLVEIETARAVDRERLLGHLDDAETARKRKELAIFSPGWISPPSTPTSSSTRRARSR